MLDGASADTVAGAPCGIMQILWILLGHNLIWERGIWPCVVTGRLQLHVHHRHARGVPGCPSAEHCCSASCVGCTAAGTNCTAGPMCFLSRWCCPIMGCVTLTGRNGALPNQPARTGTSAAQPAQGHPLMSRQLRLVHQCLWKLLCGQAHPHPRTSHAQHGRAPPWAPNLNNPSPPRLLWCRTRW